MYTMAGRSRVHALSERAMPCTRGQGEAVYTHSAAALRTMALMERPFNFMAVGYVVRAPRPAETTPRVRRRVRGRECEGARRARAGQLALERVTVREGDWPAPVEIGLCGSPRAKARAGPRFRACRYPHS